MGYWKRERVRQRGLMPRNPISDAGIVRYSTDSEQHQTLIGKPETAKPKAEYRRPRTKAERSGTGAGSSWRDAPPAHKLPSKKAGKRGIAGPRHRAGKARSMTLPDYRSGNADVDAVQSSIARDMLELIGKLG